MAKAQTLPGGMVLCRLILFVLLKAGSAHVYNEEVYAA